MTPSDPDGTQLAIGIDVGGTNLRLALVDGCGSIIHSVRTRTEGHGVFSAFRALLTENITALRHYARERDMLATTIGIGVPGLVGRDGSIHVAVNLPALNGVNLRDELQAITGLPTIVANDVNACAYGEKVYGAGRDLASFLMVTLGTGVGGGLVLDGGLWTGFDGVAGEFGHVTVEPEGVPCPCGNRGCLEQYASGTAITASSRRIITEGVETSLSQIPPDGLTVESVASAARRGDQAALAIFAEAGRYLGIAAASVANLLNLEAVILGGGVAACSDLFAETVRNEVLTRAFPLPGKRMRIVKAALGDNGGLIGIATLSLHHQDRRKP
ncbi:MAG: ROK family protein [Desulfuromonadales bacterium]|nr:MAG: ROK family protein [Desulfuromonadales bacterium]